jgi:hypothetical protein
MFYSLILSNSLYYYIILLLSEENAHEAGSVYLEYYMTVSPEDHDTNELLKHHKQYWAKKKRAVKKAKQDVEKWSDMIKSPANSSSVAINNLSLPHPPPPTNPTNNDESAATPMEESEVEESDDDNDGSISVKKQLR